MLIIDAAKRNLPDFQGFYGMKSREMAIYCYIKHSNQICSDFPSLPLLLAHARLFV